MPSRPPTGFHTDAGQADDDIRALLAALPDPGPMPEHVCARIAASLELAELERQEGEDLTRELGLVADELDEADEIDETRVPWAPDGAAPPPGSEWPHPTVAQRRRRAWPTILAGAAGIAVVAVAGGALVRGLTSPSDGAASVAGPPATASVATRVTGHLHVQASSTAYTLATLPAQARTLLTSPGADLTPSASDTPASADYGPVGTRSGIDACLAALGEADAASVSIDLAAYEGQPAAVIVVTRGDDATVYAVQRSCTTGDPQLLRDAMPVP